jgi:hypothetical protein
MVLVNKAVLYSFIAFSIACANAAHAEIMAMPLGQPVMDGQVMGVHDDFDKDNDYVADKRMIMMMNVQNTFTQVHCGTITATSCFNDMKTTSYCTTGGLCYNYRYLESSASSIANIFICRISPFISVWNTVQFWF